jgi:hypothetical protein
MLKSRVTDESIICYVNASYCSISEDDNPYSKERYQDNYTTEHDINRPSIRTIITQNETIDEPSPIEDQKQSLDWSVSYYETSNEENDSLNPVSTRDLIYWAFQTARGMDYLASQKVLDRFNEKLIFLLQLYV